MESKVQVLDLENLKPKQSSQLLENRSKVMVCMDSDQEIEEN